MKIVFAVALLFLAHFAFATNGKTTYQAKIVKPDGYPLESANVNFRFSVLDAGGSCVLYVEDYAAVNMIGSGGLISFSLGDGVRSYPVSGTSLTFQNTFDNSLGAMACQNTGSFIPVSTDSRKIVMQFNDSSGWQTLPAMGINAVPYAMYADKSKDSKTLNGKSDTAFVERSTLAALSCNSATHAIAFNGVSFSCIPVSGGSGSVTGVTTAGSVLITGGTSAAPVISITAATMSSDGYLTSVDYAEFKAKLSVSSTQIVNTLGYAPVSGAAVTSLISASGVTSATADTIVKRDSSGNSSFSGVSANTASLNYVDIYKPSTNLNIRLQAPTSLSANYTLNLPTTSGTTGQVLSTDGAGNLSWVNSATGSVTSVSGTASEITSSGGSNPTIGLVNTGTAGTYYRVTTDNKGRVTSGVTTLVLSDLPASVLNTTSNFSGDITGLISNITVNRIQGVSVTVSSLTTNDILQFDGSKYVNRNIPTCSGSQYLTFNGSSFSCVSDAGASGTITTVSVTGPISSTGGSNPTISIAQSNSSTDGYLSSTDFNSFNNKQSATSAALVTTLGYTPANSATVSSLASTVLNKITSSAASIAEVLGYTPADAVNVTSLASTVNAVSSSVTTKVTSSTASVIEALGYTPASSASVSTLVTTVANKITSSAASIAEVLGYVPASATASANYLVKTNNLSDLSSASSARTNLGLGSLAVGNSIDLGSASATGTISDARLLTQTGITSGTQYTKVTVDGKGRVISGAQLASNDVTTALGYTPASASASTQWTTSGTSIFFNTGNVGIGLTNPSAKLDVSGAIRISMDVTACSAANAGAIRYNAAAVEFCNGTSWSAFGVAGAGITNINGSTSATQTFTFGISGLAPAIATLNGLHSFNVPYAASAGVTAGLLSFSDYTSFTNKMNATSGAIITALGYTPANSATVATLSTSVAGKITSSAASISEVLGYVPASATASANYVVRTNNLSDLSSASSARTNLGLGTLAVGNSIDLGSASATGTIADARLLAQTGITSGTQYTKVTVDGKGRVISGALIASSDITTALGYAPVSSSAATQWVTSGSAISYTSGNVGIGNSPISSPWDNNGSTSYSNPKLTLSGNGATGGLSIVTDNAAIAGNAPTLSMSRSYGSVVSPTSVASGSYVMTLIGSGHDGATYLRAAQIHAAIDLTPSTSSMPGRLVFSTTASGSVNPLERMRIDSNGNVGIGTTNPVSKLHIENSTNTASPSDNVDVVAKSVNRNATFSTDVSSGSAGSIVFREVGTEKGRIIYYSDNALTIQTNLVEKMRVTSAGAVGIGTSTPSAKLDVSGAIRISMDATACTAGNAGAIRYNAATVQFCNGTSWSAFGVAGAGITNINGSTSATQTFAFGITGLAPAISTLNGIHSFNVPYAASSGVTAGLLSFADYTTFTDKLSSSTASINAVLGYTPANSATVSALATTVAGKITSSSASIAQVLGYVPAASGGVSSQWTTSGTTINYTTGNVGVGTVAPTAKFEVSGAISGTTVTSVNYSIQGGNGNSIILKSYQDSGSNGSVYLGNGAGGFSTTGHATFFNTIMGHGSYMNNSSGAGNSIFGKSAAGGGSGSYNTVMGTFAAQNGIGDDNVIIGSYAGQGSAATNMSGNTLVGRQAGQNITTGSNNTVIGFLSASGSVGTGSNNILIGYNTGMAVSSTSNFINIGNTIYGNISTGNVGFGVTAPTALLQLKAGTASTGSLKFTSGTLLSSAQSGTMEYDGAQFYLTDGTNTRRTIATGSIAGSIDNASLINSTGNITMTPTGSVIVSSTTASTNSATGALVVKGGLGVAGNIYSSGTIITSSNIQGASITATSGMISPFIYGSTISGGDLRIESTTHATPGYITLAASGGSVGIGTLTPTEVLSVVGSGTGGRVARIVQTASSISNGSHTFEINSTSHTSNMTTAGAMAVDVNSGRAFTINGLGRIGIATSSPATLFANSNLNSLDSSSVGVTGSGIAWVSSATGYVATFTNLDATSGSRNVLLARAAATDATSYIFRGESGGVNRFTVRADGNVGIGTNSPQDKFDVLAGAVRSSRNPAQYMSIYGGDSTNQQVYIKGQAAENNKKRFTLQSVHDGSGSAAGFLGFEFQVGVVSAPTTMMTINEAGNVGIGINNPAQKLSVSGVIESTVGGFKFPDGTTQTTAATSAGATSIRAGWPDAIRCAYDASGQTVVMFPYGIYSDGSQDYIAGSPANYYIRFAADGSYTSATGLFNGTALNCVGRTLAQLTNSGQTWLLAGGGGNIWTQGVSGTYLTGGNVGIGTTSPSTTLDVRTSVSSSIKISDGGIEVQRNEPTSPNTGGYIDLKKSLNDDYRVRLYFNAAGGASAEGGLSIAVSDGVSSSEKAFFSSNGNVGIGASAPTSKLEVAGDIKATGGGSIGVTRVLGTIGSNVTNITSSYTYIGDTITLPAGTWIVYYNNFYDTDGVTNFTTASYTHPGLSTTTASGGMFDNGNVNVCGLNFCPINQTYFVTTSTTTTYYVLQHISSYPGTYVRIRGGSWGKFFALKVN